MRKLAAAIAMTATLTTSAPADAGADRSLEHLLERRNRRAALAWIAETLNSPRWQAWIAALTPRNDGTWFTGPECAGRWRVPTYIVWRESRCGWSAENPTSTASGPYQMLDGSFSWAARQAGLGQYAGHASYAPQWVQHEAARMLWADSPGHWAVR